MEKPKRPMTLEESSIFVNVKKLRRLLWWATFNMMPKPEWWDYLVLNKQRVCLQPKPQYTERNRIIRKYKLLKHETGRKRAAA